MLNPFTALTRPLLDRIEQLERELVSERLTVESCYKVETYLRRDKTQLKQQADCAEQAVFDLTVENLKLKAEIAALRGQDAVI